MYWCPTCKCWLPIEILRCLIRKGEKDRIDLETTIVECRVCGSLLAPVELAAEGSEEKEMEAKDEDSS